MKVSIYIATWESLFINQKEIFDIFHNDYKNVTMLLASTRIFAHCSLLPVWFIVPFHPVSSSSSKLNIEKRVILLWVVSFVYLSLNVCVCVCVNSVMGWTNSQWRWWCLDISVFPLCKHCNEKFYNELHTYEIHLVTHIILVVVVIPELANDDLFMDSYGCKCIRAVVVVVVIVMML